MLQGADELNVMAKLEDRKVSGVRLENSLWLDREMTGHREQTNSTLEKHLEEQDAGSEVFYAKTLNFSRGAVVVVVMPGSCAHS